MAIKNNLVINHGSSTDVKPEMIKKDYRTATGHGKREMTKEEFMLWLKKFDTDNDGRISRKELREAIRVTGGWFSRWKSNRGMKSADSNGNGFIDDNEINNLVEFAEKKMGVRIVAY